MTKTYASATCEYLNSHEALITVEYPHGGFGVERVTRPRNGDLYEAAYEAASVKALLQGFELGRFSVVLQNAS